MKRSWMLVLAIGLAAVTAGCAQRVVPPAASASAGASSTAPSTLATVPAPPTLATAPAATPSPMAMPVPTPNTTAPSTDASKAKQNEATAQAEAKLLVAKAILPPGAAKVTAQPLGLDGPAMGTPQISHLIDHVTYYRVPLPLARAEEWFQKHPPRGLTGGESGSGGGPGYETLGFAYDLTPTPAWSSGPPQLEIELASSKAGTSVRVDGMTIWIDPTPVRDRSSGPGLRVTIAGGCPSSDDGWSDISNPDSTGLEQTLLPSPAPTAALQCDYNGINGQVHALLASRRLDAKQAAKAAAGLLALPLGSAGTGVTSCPSDDGRASILAFSYPGRPDVDIWEYTSGCGWDDNGYIQASYY